MTTLLENPLPIIVAGGLAATLALVVFLSRRNAASLAALVGAVAVTAILLLVERFVTTDREQVENSIAAMLDAVEANNVAGVLDHIDPAAAKIRADVQALMPLIKVDVANAASVDVTVDDATNPPSAAVTCRAYLHGIHHQSGTPVGYINQQVDLHWLKRGDRWLLDSYTAYFDGQRIDAVSSAAANRPAPVTGS